MDVVAGLQFLFRRVAESAPRSMVPVLVAGTVESVSPLRVVLDSDPSGTPMSADGTWCGGTLTAGQAVRCELLDSTLTIVAAPAAITALTARVTALESPGPWVTCAMGAGFTGAAWVRKVGPSMAEIAATANGTIPEGNTSPLVVIPTTYQPVSPAGTGVPRLAAYLSGGYECIAWIGTDGLGVTQRTGAARTSVQVRGIYGL